MIARGLNHRPGAATSTEERRRRAALSDCRSESYGLWMARKEGEHRDEPKHWDEPTLQLVHPVYLDTPMLVSFVAAAEDGFAFESEETEKGATATDRTREATGRVRAGFPALGSLIGLDMSGRYGRKDQEQESRETKVVRQHTEASLFNLLRHELIVQDRITVIERGEQLSGLEIGDLVEIMGEIVGNPLQQMLDLFFQILPYLGHDVEALMKPKKREDPGKSGNPAVRAGAGQSGDLEEEDSLRLLATMRGDLDNGSVRDLVLLGPMGIRAVLALSTEFLTPAAADRLLGGRFTAIGKVSRVLAPDESINLTRRTVLGLGGPAVARKLVTGFTSDNSLFVDIGDPVVEPPAVQLLPLAVFV